MYISKYNHCDMNGKRIGLLGGSFNPPHQGHIHISKIALQTLQLDAVWWLLTPQNPHKSADELMSYEERLKLCNKITAPYPRIYVSQFENLYKFTHSYATIKALTSKFPHTDFVWCTGLDNALTFHKWYRWREILKMVPTAHIVRPPASSIIENCPLKLQSTQKHLYIARSQHVALKPGQTYWIMQRKMMSLSSTAIRRENKNKSKT